MAAPGSEKSSKKKTEKKLAAREEAKLLASFMGVMNAMRKQVREALVEAESPAPRCPCCPEGRSRSRAEGPGGFPSLGPDRGEKPTGPGTAGASGSPEPHSERGEFPFHLRRPLWVLEAEDAVDVFFLI